MTLQPNLPTRKRIFCNTCTGETNHVAQGDFVQRTEDNDDAWMWQENIYRLWMCAGCESGMLEICYTNASIVDESGEQAYMYEYHPMRMTGSIATKSFVQLPAKLQRIYKETIQAFNADLDLLCACGLRALIEGICEDKGIQGGNLEKKVDALTSLLPKNIVESLHGFRFMGNTAIHELTPPHRYDLILAIAVSEDLLNYLYELDYKATQLRLRTEANGTLGHSRSASRMERTS